MARVSFVEVMAVCVMVVCLVASKSSAFVLTPPATTVASLATPAVLPSPSDLRTSPRCRRSAIRMSEEEQAVEEPAIAVENTEDPAAETTSSLKSFFAPNTNVRLGASRDQDGKSNVWAVEPSMKVEGKDVETPSGNGLAITGAIVGVLVIVMAATIFSLPSPDAL